MAHTILPHSKPIQPLTPCLGKSPKPASLQLTSLPLMPTQPFPQSKPTHPIINELLHVVCWKCAPSCQLACCCLLSQLLLQHAFQFLVLHLLACFAVKEKVGSDDITREPMCLKPVPASCFWPCHATTDSCNQSINQLHPTSLWPTEAQQTDQVVKQ